ncbi:MAG: hypothetical protein HOB84_06365 [Candidatus Marinimicrobia bacterium]|jgi:hypothetical protein|nr:hypothetical protein [Candidatus Neomarinimicrobiota bacterium]MBT4714374.1 hypothetical protein [Candidatus Neomarinimicrobiota bacterium]MBT4945301.1 hypothetical protein [Candidatus Neomarinimicrobiota bacterium]MBT6010553.1 hypothetical protein [Candidatus Neomarinimicrobiota bacterium]
MQKIFKHLKKGFVGGFVLLMFIGFAVDTMQSMPDHAQVFVDDSTKIYYSPMYFYDYDPGAWYSLRLTTAEEAHDLGYKPHKLSRKMGYFYQDTGVLLHEWIEDLGIHSQEKRWNPDGSWNW